MYTSLGEIERKKALAQQLQGANYDPRGGVASGLAHVLRQWAGGKAMRQASEAETANEKLRNTEMQALSKALMEGSEMPQFSHPDVSGAVASNQLAQALAASKTKTDKPMSQREWEHYTSLTPSDQRAYLNMKRSATSNFLDLGGQYRDMTTYPGQAPLTQPWSPASVTSNGPVETPTQPSPQGIPKTLSPEKQPEYITQIDNMKRDNEKTAGMEGIGAIIDQSRAILGGEVKPTSSGLGAVVDMGGAVAGITPDGAAEADQLKALGGALVMKMPRMEGPQSDADQRNYREMAGQIGDPTLPIDRRLAALDAVEQLWRKYEKTPEIDFSEIDEIVNGSR